MDAVRARATGPAVMPPEQARGLGGLEMLQGMIDGKLPYPPICDALDFLLLEVAKGRALFQGLPQFKHYNPIGSVHAGFHVTLLDSCMACAVHSLLAPGQGYTTLEVKINFTRALTGAVGPVRAEGKVIQSGRQIATAEGRLVDAAGKLYSHGTTTCLIFTL
ncbi:MAG TPA: PaaI family thioesterase [Burkholderiales bacterium]|nr:PaaI family thioesterase [Burkholderiales bacterium]